MANMFFLFLLVVWTGSITAKQLEEELCVKYAGGSVYPHTEPIKGSQHNLQFTKAVSKCIGLRLDWAIFKIQFQFPSLHHFGKALP